MRDLVIRYVPKFLDQELYRVYVPINGKLTPFNFFSKQEAINFLSSIIDGDFTEEELRVIMISPETPKRERRSSGRSEVIPLGERSVEELHGWSANKRKKLVYTMLKDEPERWFRSRDFYHAAKEMGDTMTLPGYASIIKRLAKSGQVSSKFHPFLQVQFREEVVFEEVRPISTLTTHKKRRQQKRIHKQLGGEHHGVDQEPGSTET